MLYKAVLIAQERNGSTLFVERIDSEYQAYAALGKEICRLLHDYVGDVTISSGVDEYENATLSADFDEGNGHLDYTLYVERGEKDD